LLTALLALAASCGADTGRLVRNRAARPEPGQRAQAGGVDEGALGAMRGLTHSVLHDRLVARGVVPEHLRQATPAQRDEIMDTFAVALGVRCEFCHNPDNFDEVTPRIVVAAAMWQKFVRSGMRQRDGSPLYCDSCHHGSPTFLRRDAADRGALTALMQQYADRLETGAGRAASCETCHGDPFRPRFMPRVPLDQPAAVGHGAPRDAGAAPGVADLDAGASPGVGAGAAPAADAGAQTH
jgi:hypothetical protein